MKFLKNILNNWRWFKQLKSVRRKRRELQEQKEIEIMKSLVIEYNLIQEKKSTLSHSQRIKVEKDITSLIACGKLKVNFKQ
ncbi:hypothetical protein [Flavobacterium sp. 102]|uniref:hypothetical protein n=1 Tax=Flavobacterium sp. 102 TaxID=2135623 RepID=UPI000EAE22FE|nr:hypothetical protein [Flavobacterium sp. 102]RKS00425.1 hypothetical protein C8C84_0033 [Flavobacterium sp. 102]